MNTYAVSTDLQTLPLHELDPSAAMVEAARQLRVNGQLDDMIRITLHSHNIDADSIRVR